jgi:hypothetical protein
MPDADAALARFARRLELAQAAARGEHKPLPPGHTSARHAQEIFAKAVKLFLEDVGLGRLTDLPLALLEACGDTDRGNLSPLFAPCRNDNRRPPPLLAVSRIQARAAKALDLMLSVPHAQRPSAKAAAHTIWKARQDWTGIFTTPGSIVQLRRDIRTGRATPDIVRLWPMPLDELGATTEAKIEALRALLSER